MFQFAQRIGCAIDYSAYPELSKCLLVGPFVPMQFAIFGYGAVENPLQNYREAIKLGGTNVDSIRVEPNDAAHLWKCVLMHIEEIVACLPGLKSAF